MANAKAKHKLNVPGTWFATDPDDDNGEGCIACNVCYTSAPDFFKEDEDGNAYVWKQPETKADIDLVTEQMESCPVNSIGQE